MNVRQKVRSAIRRSNRWSEMMWRLQIVDEETKKGNVEEILPRKNELIRPAVANIDLALIIFAAAKPQPNFNLLDRFLMHDGISGCSCDDLL